jgi:hypothetical protein
MITGLLSRKYTPARRAGATDIERHTAAGVGEFSCALPNSVVVL